MTQLAKLTVRTVQRASRTDPTQQRRDKLIDKLEQQAEVLAAKLNGEEHQERVQAWVTNEQGEKVAVEKLRKVRAWFFEQDGGWYVQCRYGSKVLKLGKGNAVFVKTLNEVGGVLETFKEATQQGELDTAIADALSKRKAA